MGKKKFDADSAFRSMVDTKASTSNDINKKSEEVKMIQTSLYITEDQHKALKIKAVMEESDMSKIVREILENELKGYMK